MIYQKTILLPENLELGQLLEEYPPQQKLTQDNLKYILGLISELPAYDHRLFTSQKEEVSYVPLSSQLLKERITNYQHYLRYLVEGGVLECDNQFFPGRKSKAYRFTEGYRVRTRVETLTSPILTKPDKVQQEKRNRALELYHHLIRHFEGLQIDVARAQSYIDQRYEEEVKSPDPHIRQNAASCYGSYQNMIYKLVNKTEMFSVDQKGHRFHSPLTNLKSALRQFLNYNGQPLVAIDLSCSQPYLASVLFRREFYQPAEDTITVTLNDLPKSTQELFSARIIDGIITHIASINGSADGFTTASSVINHNDRKHNGSTSKNNGSSTVIDHDSDRGNENNASDIVFKSSISSVIKALSPPSPPVPIMCEKLTLSPSVALEPVTTDEIQNYLKQVGEGSLYEYLKSQIERVTGRRIKSRQQSKEMVSTTLFSSNEERRAFLVARKQAFRSVFPWIFDLLELFKQEEHAYLAYLLQTIESEIFLNRIAGRINRERPDMPLFSIHDCLATTPEHEGYLNQVMIEELESATGLTPHLKREVW